MRSKIKLTSLLKPRTDEICTVGFHVVKGHERACRSGVTTWVDPHTARNRVKSKIIYLPENIQFLFWTADLSGFGLLNEVKPYGGQHEIDQLIQFWIFYWKSQGIKFPGDLDPLMIKAQMGV